MTTINRPDSAAAAVTANLSDLAKKLGADSAEMEILREDDNEPGFPNNNAISAAEVDAATANPPPDANFVSSKAVDTFVKKLGAGNANTGTPINSLTIPWQKQLALHAANGKGGNITQAELLDYLHDTLDHDWTANPADPPRVVPDQRLAVLKDEIADITHESDLMATGATGRVLDRGSYKVAYDDEHRIPRYVIDTLSAEDMAVRPIDSRRMADETDSTSEKSAGKFVPDPELMAAGVGADPSWLNGSGYDRGHHMPYQDYADVHAADKSFLMCNISPQTPENNQHVWVTLEEGVRKLIGQTGATATIITGNVFLDSKGNPLPEDEVTWIGPDKHVPNGKRRLAVPTHWYKAVLLQMPDGKYKTFAYLIPNTHDLPTDKSGMAALLKNSEISIDALDHIVGDKFFRDVPNRASLVSQANGMESVTQE